jgi:hypothetical protein
MKNQIITYIVPSFNENSVQCQNDKRRNAKQRNAKHWNAEFGINNWMPNDPMPNAEKIELTTPNLT